MEEKQKLDLSKPFVIYKNKGCYWGFLSAIFATPFAMALLSLIFPDIAMLPWGANLAILLGSAALWVLFIRLGSRHPDSETPVVIVSPEGLRSCRDTVFVKPWFVSWEDFLDAEVRVTRPGGAEHLAVMARNPASPQKVQRLYISLADTLYTPDGLLRIIQMYRRKSK